MADTEKTVLVLANSVRSDPSRCVAGREVIGDRFGRWVRPVSTNGCGEVSYRERTLTNGNEVAVLDVVRMPLTGRVADELQPENWAITGERTWTLVRRAHFRELEELVENPKNMWNEPNARNDSISEEYLRKNPPSQSLYLIRPSALRLDHSRLPKSPSRAAQASVPHPRHREGRTTRRRGNAASRGVRSQHESR